MGRKKKKEVLTECINPRQNQIYQLKISLKHISPPIWRRILCFSNANFQDLHEAIQQAFEWDDCHLHEFYFPRKGFWTPFRIQMRSDINESDNKNWNFSRFWNNQTAVNNDINSTRWEDEIQLKEVFSEDRKSLSYLYDFGDNWDHKVALEKIYSGSLNKHLYFPICIKGKRRVPETDSQCEYEELINEEEELYLKYTNNYDLSHVITQVKIHDTGYVEILKSPSESNTNIEFKFKKLSKEPHFEEEIELFDELNDNFSLINSFNDQLAKEITSDINNDLICASSSMNHSGDNIHIIMQKFLTNIKKSVTFKKYQLFEQEIQDFLEVMDRDGLYVLENEYKIKILPLQSSIVKEKHTKSQRFTLQFGLKALIFTLFSYLDPLAAEDYCDNKLYAKKILCVYSNLNKWLLIQYNLSTELYQLFISRLRSLQYEMSQILNENINIEITEENEKDNSILTNFRQKIDIYKDRFGFEDDEFDTTTTEFKYPSFNDLSEKELGEWDELLKIATLLRDLKPWNHFTSLLPIAIEDPKTKQICYCIIMGHLGEHYGIACFLGDFGLEGMQFLNNHNSQDIFSSENELLFGALLKKYCISVSFEPQIYLEPMDRNLYHVLNQKVPSLILACKFRKFIPGFYPWKLDIQDIQFLKNILSQIMFLVESLNHGQTDLNLSDIKPDTYILRKKPSGENIPASKWITEIISKKKSLNFLPYRLFDYIKVQNDKYNMEWNKILKKKIKSILEKEDLQSYRKQHIWIIGDVCLYEFSQGDLKNISIVDSSGVRTQYWEDISNQEIKISLDTPYIQNSIICIDENSKNMLFSICGSAISLYYNYISCFLDYIINHNWYPEKIQCLNSNFIPHLNEICGILKIPFEKIDNSKLFDEYVKMSDILEEMIENGEII